MGEMLNPIDGATSQYGKGHSLKGHPTDEQVEEGKIERSQNEGNDNPGRTASEGVDEHIAGLRAFVQWLDERHKQ